MTLHGKESAFFRFFQTGESTQALSLILLYVILSTYISFIVPSSNSIAICDEPRLVNPELVIEDETDPDRHENSEEDVVSDIRSSRHYDVSPGELETQTAVDHA